MSNIYLFYTTRSQSVIQTYKQDKQLFVYISFRDCISHKHYTYCIHVIFIRLHVIITCYCKIPMYMTTRYNTIIQEQIRIVLRQSLCVGYLNPSIAHMLLIYNHIPMIYKGFVYSSIYCSLQLLYYITNVIQQLFTGTLRA